MDDDLPDPAREAEEPPTVFYSLFPKLAGATDELVREIGRQLGSARELAEADPPRLRALPA
jgi:hypothetical protein